MESVLFIYVFFLVLVWPCQLFVRIWYRVSDVLDLSLVSKRFGCWPHITHVIALTFKEIKHLSDYRTVGLSDRLTIGLSDHRSDPDSVALFVSSNRLSRKSWLEPEALEYRIIIKHHYRNETTRFIIMHITSVYHLLLYQLEQKPKTCFIHWT